LFLAKIYSIRYKLKSRSTELTRHLSHGQAMPGGNPRSKNKAKKSEVGKENGVDVLAAKQTTTFKQTTKILEEVKKRLEAFSSYAPIYTDSSPPQLLEDELTKNGEVTPSWFPLTAEEKEASMKTFSPSYTPTYDGSPPPPKLEEDVLMEGDVTPSWPPKTAEEREAEKLLDAAGACFTPTSVYSQTSLL
jgi:hypothetical protein